MYRVSGKLKVGVSDKAHLGFELSNPLIGEKKKLEFDGATSLR